LWARQIPPKMARQIPPKMARLPRRPSEIVFFCSMELAKHRQKLSIHFEILESKFNIQLDRLEKRQQHMWKYEVQKPVFKGRAKISLYCPHHKPTLPEFIKHQVCYPYYLLRKLLVFTPIRFGSGVCRPRPCPCTST
jgi:hypothetical protein